MTSDVLRTLDERFAGLSGWSVAPHYLDVDGLRIHVDEGPRAGRTALLLHGEPSWAYLYRNTLFGAEERITLGAETIFQSLVPGAAGQPHALVERAAHFIQEDAGEELAERVVAFARGRA